MNVFLLHSEQEKCAQSHCDRHIAPQLVTISKIISGGLRLRGHRSNLLYPTSFESEPWVRWAAESSMNIAWLTGLAAWLDCEYKYRFGPRGEMPKHHVAYLKIASWSKMVREHYTGALRTAFIQKVPEECLAPGDPVGAYRKYYTQLSIKSPMTFTDRELPHWLPKKNGTVLEKPK